jgi:hypothetical protein
MFFNDFSSFLPGGIGFKDTREGRGDIPPLNTGYNINVNVVADLLKGLTGSPERTSTFVPEATTQAQDKEVKKEETVAAKATTTAPGGIVAVEKYDPLIPTQRPIFMGTEGQADVITGSNDLSGYTPPVTGVTDVDRGISSLSAMNQAGGPYAQNFTGAPAVRTTKTPPFGDPETEASFQNWYRKNYPDLHPDPDDPRQQYDYRAFFSSGGERTFHPGTGTMRSPSEYKLPGHHLKNIVATEGQFKGQLIDSRTGAPVYDDTRFDDTVRTYGDGIPREGLTATTADKTLEEIAAEARNIDNIRRQTYLMDLEKQRDLSGQTASEELFRQERQKRELLQKIMGGYQRATPEEEKNFFAEHPYYGEVEGNKIYINEERMRNEGSSEDFVEEMFFGEALHGLKESVPEWYNYLYNAAERDPEVMRWKQHSFDVVKGKKPDESGVIRTENLEERDIDDWWVESRFDQLVGGYLLGGKDSNVHTLRNWDKNRLPFGTEFRKALEDFRKAVIPATPFSEVIKRILEHSNSKENTE